MRNPFLIEIKLRQHTPIIHFQHEQFGATLRATELKPKLDKFIVKLHFRGEFDKYKNYLVGFNEKEYNNLSVKDQKEYREKYYALAYKVRIKSPKIEKKDIKDIKHSLFFGNIGKKKKGEKEIKSVCLNNDKEIELTIFSFREGLLNIVSKNIAHFYSLTNFGTRQNKGFGSFYISEDDKTYFKDISEVLPKDTYYIEIGSIDDDEIFLTLDYYYKRLKSGINPFRKGKCKPEQYRKAYLYLYLDDKNLGYSWEKRWIKETFFGLKPDNKKKKFARALLGLPGNYLYKATNEPCNPGEEKIKISKICNINVENKNISRIKSPITFKIIKDFNKRNTRVFILLEEELIRKIDSKCKEKTEFNFKTWNREGKLKLPDRNILIEDLIKCYNEKELEKRINDEYEGIKLNAVIEQL